MGTQVQAAPLIRTVQIQINVVLKFDIADLHEKESYSDYFSKEVQG